MASFILEVNLPSTADKSEVSRSSFNISPFQFVDDEQLLSVQRQRAATRWAMTFIAVLMCIFAVLVWWCETKLHEENLDAWNDTILILSYVTLSVTVLFIIALALVWNESEIMAVQHDFTIFFFFFAIMNSVAHIVYVLAPGSAAPNGPFIDNVGFAFYKVLLCFSMQCTLIGSLVLRQRLFYLIFRCYDLNPSFWVAVPAFMFVCLCIASPLIVCGYYECGPYVPASIHFAMTAVMTGAFGYYLYYTYQGSSLFVQFWQNMRAYVLNTVTQLIIFGLYLSQYPTIRLKMVMATFFVWLIMLDTFSVPLLRAIARKFLGMHLWGNIDFTGLPLRMLSNQNSLESSLQNKKMRTSLEAFANHRYAGENIRFLSRVDELYSKSLSNQVTTNEIQKAIDDFIRPNGCDRLNLMCATRRNTISSFEKDEPVTKIFGAAEREIKTLFAIQIWRAFIVTDEYKALKAEQERDERAETNLRNALYNIGVLPKYTSPRNTDSIFETMTGNVVMSSNVVVSSMEPIDPKSSALKVETKLRLV